MRSFGKGLNTKIQMKQKLPNVTESCIGMCYSFAIENNKPRQYYHQISSFLNDIVGPVCNFTGQRAIKCIYLALSKFHDTEDHVT